MAGGACRRTKRHLLPAGESRIRERLRSEHAGRGCLYRWSRGFRAQLYQAEVGLPWLGDVHLLGPPRRRTGRRGQGGRPTPTVAPPKTRKSLAPRLVREWGGWGLRPGLRGGGGREGALPVPAAAPLPRLFLLPWPQSPRVCPWRQGEHHSRPQVGAGRLRASAASTAAT